MAHHYDIIVFGGGVAGLFTANRLQRLGYNVIVIEKDTLGGTQTLASQGMIHGGQKYALQGRVTAQGSSVAEMPARWDACFEGWGDVDLSETRFLSQSQVMFPAGSFFSKFSAIAAAWAVNGRMKRLERDMYPQVLAEGPVYGMQEKVLETKSLIAALAENMKGRVFKGTAQELLPDGQVAVDGFPLRAQMVVFAAGAGNETALEMLKVTEKQTQRRPLRQIMVKSLSHPLFGHGIISSPKPRVTITSHPAPEGGYIWYLGGNIAEKSAGMTESEALLFAAREMKEIFPAINWAEKEWASWQGDRAEPFDSEGRLPQGPCVQQRGQVLIAWPSKLTLAPALADSIFNRLKQAGIKPSLTSSPPPLPEARMGTYPWEEASWQRL